MILQIVGFKDSGKTTLLQQSITFLKSQGYHIVTIKHHGHEKMILHFNHLMWII